MKNLVDVYINFFNADVSTHWLFVAVIGAILLDIILGYMVAWASNKFDSKKGRIGLVKHGALILAIALIYPVSEVIGVVAVVDTLLVFFALSFVSSIIANFQILGVPFPEWLTDKLKNEIDKKNNKE